MLMTPPPAFGAPPAQNQQQFQWPGMGGPNMMRPTSMAQQGQGMGTAQGPQTMMPPQGGQGMGSQFGMPNPFATIANNMQAFDQRHGLPTNWPPMGAGAPNFPHEHNEMPSGMPNMQQFSQSPIGQWLGGGQNNLG